MALVTFVLIFNYNSFLMCCIVELFSRFQRLYLDVCKYSELRRTSRAFKPNIFPKLGANIYGRYKNANFYHRIVNK